MKGVLAQFDRMRDQAERERLERIEAEHNKMIKAIRKAVEKTQETGEEAEIEGFTVFGRALWVKP